MRALDRFAKEKKVVSRERPLVGRNIQHGHRVGRVAQVNSKIFKVDGDGKTRESAPWRLLFRG